MKEPKKKKNTKSKSEKNTTESKPKSKEKPNVVKYKNGDTRERVSHEIMTKGVFYLTLKNGSQVKIFGQCHSLVYIDEEYEDGDWNEVNREETDDYYLTENEKGYLFEIDDLKKLFNTNDYDWDSNGVSYNWSGIDDNDDSDMGWEKYMKYKSKFKKVTSKDQFNTI